MELIVQSPREPERIIRALEDLADPSVDEIRIGSAYVTLSGSEILVSALRNKLAPAAWNRSIKRIVSCVDYGLTEPKALEFWLNQDNSYVFVHNSHLIGSGSFHPSAAFHAKYYEYRRPQHSSIAIGSANLTERALTLNTEVLVVNRKVTPITKLDRVWNAIAMNSVQVTPQLIAAYLAARRLAPPVLDPKVPIPTTSPALTLWDANQSGACNPANFDSFWVDSGSMRSGGSQNQLELPRGASRYFGFTYTTYSGTSGRIGDLNLILGSIVNAGKHLSWHGHNRMERLNLPTGIDYSNKVVLFYRRKNGFELFTTASGSDRANAWRSASESIASRFRVGRAGSRTCGLF